jgi:hypothetical protein
MAGGLDRRLGKLEVAAGITEPDHLHVVFIDYFALGPAIPPYRCERHGQPDLLMTTERRRYDDLIGKAATAPGNAPQHR